MSPPPNPTKTHLLEWKSSPYTAIPASESHISIPESSHSQKQPYKFRNAIPFLLHFLFFTTYTTIFFASQRNSNRLDPLGIPYEQKIFEVSTSLNTSSARLYAGEPSEELEAAWGELLKSILPPPFFLKESKHTDVKNQDANIRIPEAEIRKLGRLDQAVRFTDGSGYFAQMTVYHHLHCIPTASTPSAKP
ncbi:hypothetical protein HYALB_00012547 [Hymenoscyphus albidus]|uniref:Uncharacterized protein n=1 Tax=Hymenoscyphus albidus TaxID=595503 RepID=A0A9N9LUU5_9HELO|nr:hypothetical protein HYALB_00012547 [Hymenoscyphus albidus]